MNFSMKVFPSEATPPSNWAVLKKEPPPLLLRWLLFGSIWTILSIGLFTVMVMMGIAIFEWSIPILYERTH